MVGMPKLGMVFLIHGIFKYMVGMPKLGMVFLIHGIFNTWFGHAQIGHGIFNTWFCIAWPASFRALFAALVKYMQRGRPSAAPLCGYPYGWVSGGWVLGNKYNIPALAVWTDENRFEVRAVGD